MSLKRAADNDVHDDDNLPVKVVRRSSDLNQELDSKVTAVDHVAGSKTPEPRNAVVCATPTAPNDVAPSLLSSQATSEYQLLKGEQDLTVKHSASPSVLDRRESDSPRSPLNHQPVHAESGLKTNNVSIDAVPSHTKLSDSPSLTVASHYNTIEEKGKTERKFSRIFHMRNFNNWIKSVCIGEVLSHVRGARVLDLGCGKGGDLLKFRISQISHLVGVDLAEVSIDQCKTRFREMSRTNNRLYTSEFHALDCTKSLVTSVVDCKTVDVTSSQFVIHYAFDTLKHADMMIRNATEMLAVDGHFLLTTPDAHELLRRVRRYGHSFGNSVYNVSFTNEGLYPLLGCQYNFFLEGVVDCPEYLVHPKLLEKLCRRHGLRLLRRINFARYVYENLDHPSYKSLLFRMKAVEKCPPDSGTDPVSDRLDDYSHLDCSEGGDFDQKSRGTLTKSEWEALTLYTVYIFKKNHIVDHGAKIPENFLDDLTSLSLDEIPDEELPGPPVVPFPPSRPWQSRNRDYQRRNDPGSRHTNR